MKRFAALLILLALLAGSAAADPVDLSGLSFEELVQLRDQLNLAIWSSEEWQEVTVPAGVYRIGADIPAGHWSISVAAATSYLFVLYFDTLDAAGLGPDFSGYVFQQQIASEDLVAYGVGIPASVDINLLSGWFLKLDGAVIFTPYAGKPDLGFK